MKINTIEDHLLDPILLDKLKVLSSRKDAAVEEEDYDRAKRVKEFMDKLKLLGEQIFKLELQKKLAIENEDFDSAKILKYEISRLRKSAFAFDTERSLDPAETPSEPREGEEGTVHEGPPETLLGENEGEGSVAEGEESRIGGGLQFGELTEKEREFERLMEEEEQKHPITVDETVIPALRLKAPIDFNTVEDDKEAFYSQLKEGAPEDEIPAPKRAAVEPLIEVFGEEVVRKFYSKKWQAREDAIDKVLAGVGAAMQKAGDSSPFHLAVLGYVGETLQDRIV